MSRCARFLVSSLLATSVVVVAVGSVCAAVPKPKPSKEKGVIDRRAAIEQALSSPAIEFEYVETPLADIVLDIEQKHGIEIEFDAKALEDAGVASDTAMTRNLKGLPLRSALRLLFDSVDLTFVIKNDVLLITTPGAASRMFEVRIYNVESLLGENESAEKVAETVSELIVPSRPDCAPETPATAARPQDPEDTRIRAYNHLIIVNAPIPVHEAMDDLLHKLACSLGSKSAVAARTTHQSEEDISELFADAPSTSQKPNVATTQPPQSVPAKKDADENDPFGREKPKTAPKKEPAAESSDADPFE